LNANKRDLQLGYLNLLEQSKTIPANTQSLPSQMNNRLLQILPSFHRQLANFKYYKTKQTLTNEILLKFFHSRLRVDRQIGDFLSASRVDLELQWRHVVRCLFCVTTTEPRSQERV
ncbi:hypothetical protein, partial [Corallococcus sp. AB049A]|uniref:hypothetical protein n=1 Tax=Corallococcus sp. AB049A TaxID=2316721 RepID=UPI001F3521BC